MLAHVENVRHAHPHPAGVPWEAVLLIAVVIAVGALAAWWTVTKVGPGTARRGRRPAGTVEGPDDG